MSVYIPNPPIPYVGPIGMVSTGAMIQIMGTPSPAARWFAINLQCGHNTNPRDDLALHFSPRFEGNFSKVIRNSLTAQQWGQEENFGHFPFLVGQHFEILILIEHDHFKIAINGQHYTEFRHRVPLNRINTVAIDGDVQLTCFRYEPGRSPSPMPMHQAPMSAPYPPGATAYPPAAPFPHTAAPYPAAAPPPVYGGGYAAPAGVAYMPQPTYGTEGYAQQPAYGFSQPPVAPSYAPSPAYHATTQPLVVPGTNPYVGGRRSPSPMYATGAAVAGGMVAGAALSRLAYPGHGGYGHHQYGYAIGHHKMKKHKFKGHKFHKPKFGKFHKPKFGKFHKPKFGKFHKPKFGKFGKHKFKGWHNQSSSSGSSSSSSSSSESSSEEDKAPMEQKEQSE